MIAAWSASVFSRSAAVWKCCSILRPQLAAPLVPQRIDDQRERAIVRGFGDSDVEGAIGCVSLIEFVTVGPHPVDGLAKRVESRPANAAGGERRDLAFDQTARREKLERPGPLVATASVLPRQGSRPVPPAVRRPAGGRKCRCRRGPRRGRRSRARSAPPAPTCVTRPAGPRARARGAAATRAEFAAVDQPRDLSRDLAIQPDRLDDLQRHARTPPCREAARVGSRPVPACALSAPAWARNVRRAPSLGQVAQPPDHGQRPGAACYGDRKSSR